MTLYMAEEKIIPLINRRPHWQQALSNALSDPKELVSLLPHLRDQLQAIQTASQDFKLLIPRDYLSKIDPCNPEDPLLKQVLPIAKELISPTDYSHDPLQESKANPIPGLLHKYPSRVLLTLTNACAVNCRYCFRRHFPYAENRFDQEAIIHYLQAHPEVNEVILSGGDPLIAKDSYLAKLSTALDSVDSIRRLRIHSRLPVMLPSRINEEFIQWFSHSKRQAILVLHSNHPNELDNNLHQALIPLRQAGVTLLNQTVLLKGVNDSAEALAALNEKLFEYGVLPYYLHCLDKVAGAAHFDLSREQISTIYEQLQTRLPGFLVPKLVREEPGKLHKSLCQG